MLLLAITLKAELKAYPVSDEIISTVMKVSGQAHLKHSHVIYSHRFSFLDFSSGQSRINIF